jgi:hypothetical protein
VHAFTLQGRWRYCEHDWTAAAGSYALEPPGAVHTLVVPEDAAEPAVVMFVVDAAMVIVDEAGSPQLVWDAAAMAGIYRAALEERDVPCPPGWE